MFDRLPRLKRARYFARGDHNARRGMRSVGNFDNWTRQRPGVAELAATAITQLLFAVAVA
jgi:hypothetical protein